MKKFSLKKGSDDDASRSKLFAGLKSRSPADASSNPYAPPPGNPYAQANATSDPYAQPASHYHESKLSVPTRSPLYPRTASSTSKASLNGSSHGGSGGSSPATGSLPPPRSNGGFGGGHTDQGYGGGHVDQGYGGGHVGQGYGGGYMDKGYGDQRGYGESRYEQRSGDSGSRYGAGGYGGLGRETSHDTMNAEAGRDALFGGAKQRYEQQVQTGELPPEQGGASGGFSDGYGAVRDRQLTAEEQEEEDVEGAKQQIRFIKQQDVSSTRNALRIAQQAEETGRSTLERLGQQGERIHNAESNLDAASRENRMAADKASELKTLNRSMFAVHVNNPFTKSQRQRDRDEKLMEQHRSDRGIDEQTRAAAYQAEARQREYDQQLRGTAGGAAKKKDLAARGKYQFEADSEDEAMEDEIDTNLDLLGGAAGRLNALGRAMGKEVESQNKHIDVITGKADKVDDQIVLNRARLDRIH